MRTLGVDLASRPKNTAACLIRWDGEGAAVERLESGLDDAALLELAEGADAIGIDAPFGWPDSFVNAVSRHHQGLEPDLGDWEDEALRRRLRLRRSDLWVWRQGVTGRPPLSVSTDLISIPALRCIGLLEALGVRDRGGDGRVYETYPAAGLAVWTGRSGGYKGRARRAECRGVFDRLIGAAPWLRTAPFDPGADDDSLDALVASMIARAASLGLVHPVPEADREVAAREGWIQVPMDGSLSRLVGPGLPPSRG